MIKSFHFFFFVSVFCQLCIDFSSYGHSESSNLFDFLASDIYSGNWLGSVLMNKPFITGV